MDLVGKSRVWSESTSGGDCGEEAGEAGGCGEVEVVGKEMEAEDGGLEAHEKMESVAWACEVASQEGSVSMQDRRRAREVDLVRFRWRPVEG